MEAGPVTTRTEFARTVFISTLLDMQVALPIELFLGHHLRRPTDSETQIIRSFLDRRDMGGSLIYEMIPESQASQQPNLGGQGRIYNRSANPADWRYFVIEVGRDHYGALNNGILELEGVTHLTDVPIEFAFWFDDRGVSMFSYDDLHRLDTIRQQFSPKPELIDMNLINELRALRDRVREVARIYSDPSIC